MACVLELGGVGPVADGVPDGAQELSAAAYTVHGRTIVRLVPEPLMEVETLTLATVGAEPLGHRVVGTTTARAVGFPAWPIISDPANARHALDLVGELEWARRRARGDRKKVKERFDELAAELGSSAPHFVPTLLEEAARVFASAGHQSFAKNMFNRAREIERTHGLAVDPDRHRAAFQEFAALGVVGTKELRVETKAAQERHTDPTDAFEYLLDLNATRFRAGSPAYGHLLKDLRDVARAANLEPDEVEDRFLDAVLGTKGLLRSSTDFLTSLSSSLVRYAKDDPAAHELLLSERPVEVSIDAYLALLADAGALAHLRSDPSRWADWLLELVGAPTTRPSRQARLVDELLAAREHLAGRTITRKLSAIPLDVADALLECGVEIIPADSVSWKEGFSWQEWLSADAVTDRRPLTYLAADPAMKDRAALGLFNQTLVGEIETLVEHPGSREIVAHRLRDLAEERNGRQLSLSGLRDFLRSAGHLAHPGPVEHFPEQMRLLLDFDPAELLAATVRGGTLSELTWPTAEESIQRLRGLSTAGEYRLHETFPALAVTAGNHVEIVDGDRVVIEGQAPLGESRVLSVRQVGDTAMVVCWDHQGGNRTYVHWLNDAGPTQVDGWTLRMGVNYSLPVSQGRLTADGLLTEGAVHLAPAHGTLLSSNTDSGAIYEAEKHSPVRRWDGTHFREVDLPLEEQLTELGLRQLDLDLPELDGRARADLFKTTLVPVYPGTRRSPMGKVGDVHVQLHLDAGQPMIITPFGRFHCPSAAQAVIERPGGGHWFASAGMLWDADDGHELTLDHDISSRRMLNRFPLAALHQTVPRDETASSVMRVYTRAQAQEVLDSAVTEPDGSVSLDRHIVENQLGTTDEELVGSVLDIAEVVAQTHRSYSDLREKAGIRTIDEEDPESPPTPEDHGMSEAVARMLDPYVDVLEEEEGTPRGFSAAPQAMASGITGILRHLADPSGTPPRDHDIEIRGWGRIIGNETLLVVRAFGPLVRRLFPDAEDRRALTGLIRQLVDSGLLCGDLHFAYLWVQYRTPTLAEVPPQAIIDGALTFGSQGYWDTDWENRYPVLLADDRADLRGVPLHHPPRHPLTREQLAAVLAAVDDLPPKEAPTLEQVVSAAVNKIVENTGLLRETLLYLLGRTPGYHRHYEMDKTARALFNFTATQARAVHMQLAELRYHLDEIACVAVPSADPVSYLHGAVDADAVIAYCRQHFGAPVIHLTAEQYASIDTDYHDAHHLIADALTPVEDSRISGDWGWRTMHAYLTVLLQVTQMRTWPDAERRFIAAKLRWLKSQAADMQKRRGGLSDAELGTEFTDPRINRDTEPHHQGIRILLEGHLDGLIGELEQPVEDRGCPWDPRNSAPDIVEAVIEKLGVSVESATYYLQVLALAVPSDAHVRGWNGWKKKDIDAAAAPLIEKGLLLEANRAGAGRKRFLPGGWLPSSPGAKGMEMWKAPLYLLWKDTKVRPILRTCPLLTTQRGVFADAWQRIADGDEPGYEELRTARYRRRR